MGYVVFIGSFNRSILIYLEEVWKYIQNLKVGFYICIFWINCLLEEFLNYDKSHIKLTIYQI